MKEILYEMAILGRCYNIRGELCNFQLHGGTDRIYPPHIHIYKEKVIKELFTIEVNFAHYLETGGDIQFCHVLDRKKNIKYTSPEDCMNYKGIRLFSDATAEFLTSKPKMKEYIDCRDNIEAAIKAFADEADMSKLHADDKKVFAKRYGSLYINMKPEYKLIFVMLSMHKTINKKFYSYFDKSLIKTFPEAFSR